MGKVTDDEPRFWGDVMPPDDPRPGDVWLSHGVRRVRLEGDRWDPFFPEYIIKAGKRRKKKSKPEKTILETTDKPLDETSENGIS